jgi:hypothetical protein
MVHSIDLERARRCMEVRARSKFDSSLSIQHHNIAPNDEDLLQARSSMIIEFHHSFHESDKQTIENASDCKLTSVMH